MANPERGEVEWIDGWRLRCSMNTRCEIEEATGRSFVQVVRSMGSVTEPRFSDLRLVVRFFLEHPSGRDRPTLREVGDMIDRAGEKATGDAVGEAIRRGMPEHFQDEGDDADPPTADG